MKSKATDVNHTGIDVFSTTADVGIRIHGEKWEDLYRLAVSAFNQLVFAGCGGDAVSDSGLMTAPFVYRGDSCENVLVNLLSECIYRLNVFQEKVERLEIKASGETYVDAVIMARHVEQMPDLEIKSVTYHNLKVKHEGNLKKVEIVFDV